MNHVHAIDLSLTATGIAGVRLEDSDWYTDTLKPGKLDGLDRINWILAQVLGHCTLGGLVVMEGPSYDSTGRGQHERAGLWWIVRRELARKHLRVAVAPPSCVKKLATGKGNAGKDAVLTATVRRFPAFDGDNNAADALWLAALGAEHLGRPIVSVPQTHREALRGVAWPELPAVTA